MLALSAAATLLWCRRAAEEAAGYGVETTLDSLYFQLVPAVGIYISILTCLFLSTEYGEGTIRNKLAVGRTRRDVYLANFTAVAAASLALQLAWMVGGCAGIPFVGPWTRGPGAFALLILLTTGTTLAMAAIFTFIGMLHTGRSATVVTVLTYFVLLFAAAGVYNVLSEPEFNASLMMSAGGGVQSVGMEPNPRYATGALRSLCEFVMDLLPTGQIARIQNLETGNPARMLLSSLFLTVSATVGGVKLFERSDLK